MDALTYAYLYMQNLILVRDEEGQDLAEYALLIALIALVVIGAVTMLDGKMKDIFDTIHKNLQKLSSSTWNEYDAIWIK